MAKKITEYIAEIQRLLELEPEKPNLLPEMQMLVALKNIGSEKGMEHEIEDEQLETEVEKLNKNGELDKFFKDKSVAQMREDAKNVDALYASFTGKPEPEKKNEEPQAAPEDNKPEEAKPVEEKPEEAKNEKEKVAEQPKEEVRPEEKKPEEVKPAEEKPVEAKQEEAQEKVEEQPKAEAKNEEAKPAEEKAAEQPKAEAKPEEAKPEVKAQEPAKPKYGDNYVLNSYGEDYLNPARYTETIRATEGTLGLLEYDTAKMMVLQTCALVINAKICEKSGYKPDLNEFNNSVVDMMDSKAFRKTVEEFGGTSIESLEKMQKSILNDGGKDLFGKFMQNADRVAKQESKNEKIKEDHQKQKEAELEVKKPEAPALGGN